MRVFSGKTRRFQLLFCLSIIWAAFSLANAQPNAAPLLKSETTPLKNLVVFEALWEKVNSKYFDANFNGINWAKMREIYRPKAEQAADQQELLTVLRKMLGELKTSHLDLWQTVSQKKIERKLLSEIDPKTDILRLNYGFSLKKIEGKPVVYKVELNSSAHQGGVKIGWELLTAQGNPVSEPDYSLGDIYEGGKIDLRFIDFENKEHTATLTADWRIKRRTQISRPLTENVAYIKFDDFFGKVAKWLQNELDHLNTDSNLIIDLRENRGGQLEEVKKCLSQFFTGEIEFGTFIERGGKVKELNLKGKKDQAFKGKIVVLIDDESYSGAEIFAQLIQENARGKIVGTHSKGFVLNSREFNLPEDFKVSIAFRDYFSPKEYRIEGKGVKPDFEVLPKISDIINNRDPALEKALEIMGTNY
jgi:C-terminal processing protease CtpA/Prc